MSSRMKLVTDKAELDLAQRIRIGRYPANEIQLSDPLVSGNHAVIDSGELVDEKSTNGTFVNDIRVPHGQKIKLNAGDVVKIGDSTIRVVEGPVKNRVVLNPPPFGVEDPSSESDPEADAPNGHSDMMKSELDPAALVAQRSTQQAWMPTIRKGVGAEASPQELLQAVQELQRENGRLVKELAKAQKDGNPRRIAQQIRNEKAQFMTKIQNLEYQILYGEEKEKNEADKRFKEVETALTETREELKMLQKLSDEERKTLRAANLELEEKSRVLQIILNTSIAHAATLPKMDTKLEKIESLLAARLSPVKDNESSAFKIFVVIAVIAVLLVQVFTIGRPYL